MTTKCICFCTLILVMLQFAACSYNTEFVVVNNSSQVAEVRYKVKKFPGSDTVSITPVAKQWNSFIHLNNAWEPLTPDRYHIDSESRVVAVKLEPGQALLIETLHHYGGHENTYDAENFSVEEIAIDGVNGVLTISEEKSRTSFVKKSKALYVLNYN